MVVFILWIKNELLLIVILSGNKEQFSGIRRWNVSVAEFEMCEFLHSLSSSLHGYGIESGKV